MKINLLYILFFIIHGHASSNEECDNHIEERSTFYVNDHEHAVDLIDNEKIKVVTKKINLNFIDVSKYILFPIYNEFLGINDIVNFWSAYNCTGKNLAGFIKKSEAQPLFDYLKSIKRSTVEINCKKIYDKDFESIYSKFSEIENLSIENCPNLSNPMSIFNKQSNKKLMSLTINKCDKIKWDFIIKSVIKCPNITKLNLPHFSELENNTINRLTKNCSNLRYLDLSWGYQFTDTSITNLVKNCPKLINLNLSHCSKLADSSIIKIEEYCSDLMRLDISFCIKDNTNSSGDNKIRGYRPNLVYFNLSGFTCKHSVFISLIKPCINLTHLDLSWCQGITHTTLIEVGINCPHIEYLYLKGYKNITDIYFIPLIKHFPKLVYLNLLGCTNLTDVSMIEIIENCLNLKYINIAECNKITAAIKKINKHKFYICESLFDK